MNHLQRLTPEEINRRGLDFDIPGCELPAHLSATYRALTIPKEIMAHYAQYGKPLVTWLLKPFKYHDDFDLGEIWDGRKFSEARPLIPKPESKKGERTDYYSFEDRIANEKRVNVWGYGRMKLDRTTGVSYPYYDWTAISVSNARITSICALLYYYSRSRNSLDLP